MGRPPAPFPWSEGGATGPDVLDSDVPYQAQSGLFLAWTTGEAVPIRMGSRSFVVPGLQAAVMAVAHRRHGAFLGRLMVKGLILGIKAWRATLHGMLGGLSIVCNEIYELAEKLNLPSASMRTACQPVDNLRTGGSLDTAGLPAGSVQLMTDQYSEPNTATVWYNRGRVFVISLRG